jgi:hypothetical protein
MPTATRPVNLITPSIHPQVHRDTEPSMEPATDTPSCHTGSVNPSDDLNSDTLPDRPWWVTDAIWEQITSTPPLKGMGKREWIVLCLKVRSPADSVLPSEALQTSPPKLTPARQRFLAGYQSQLAILKSSPRHQSTAEADRSSRPKRPLNKLQRDIRRLRRNDQNLRADLEAVSLVVATLSQRGAA